MRAWQKKTISRSELSPGAAQPSPPHLVSIPTVRGTLSKPYEHSRNPYEVHETSSEAFKVLITPLDHFAHAYLPWITFEHAPSLWDIMMHPQTDANIVRRLSNPTLYGRAASRVSGLASALGPRRSSSSHCVVYSHTPCKGNLRLFSLVFPCKVSSICTVFSFYNWLWFSLASIGLWSW
jgi:hypothetical protein